MKRIFPILAILLIIPAVASATDYYVTQGGGSGAMSVDDFNGLTGNKGGNTYYFSGTITTTIQPHIYGSSGSYVTLDGWEGGTCNPINYECGDSAEVTASDLSFSLNSKDYFIIQDFRASGNRMQLNGCDHVTIRRNYIHDNDGNGIDVDDSTYITVGGAYGDGNAVKDVGTTTASSDVSFEGSSADIIISYNHLYATKSNGNSNDRGIDGIVTQPANRVLIEYNTIHGHKDRYGELGENAIDLKAETSNVIVRYNHFYDHWSENHILLHGGTQNAYVYGNMFRDGVGGILFYQRSQYRELKDNHAWSNIFSGLGDSGIGSASGGGEMGVNYVYNNIFGFNGFDYTDLGGTAHPAGTYDTGMVIELGNFYVKNNIFYENHPEMSSYIQAATTSNSNIASLEHNTYYWPSHASYVRYDGASRTVSTLQSSYNLEDDSPAGKDNSPGFNDPDGQDNTYGTADDDYTLNGNNINDGEALSQCFDLSIQGKNYHMCYSDALDPATDWTTIPPNVVPASQNDYGSWERGAYVYTGGVTQSCADIGYCCPSGSTCSSPRSGSGCSGTCCASSSQCTVNPGCGDQNCDTGECDTCPGDCTQSYCCGIEGCNPSMGETCSSCDDCGACSGSFLPGTPVEAEAAVLTSPMQTGSDSLASGDSYIFTTTDHQGSASYTFGISVPGDYILQGRIIAPTTADDSFYVGLDGEQTQGDNYYAWDTIKTSVWAWDNVSQRGAGTTDDNEFDPMIWTLSAGSHTFTFFGRDEDTLLDQIRLLPLSVEPPAEPTCQSTGGSCCSQCSPGTSQSEYDQDCDPQVCCSQCYQEPTPSNYDYSILKTPTPPDIDGDLSEFSGVTSITLTDHSTGTTGTYRLLWDDIALYIAASFQDADLNALNTEDDVGLWADDSLEIMFDVSNNGGGTLETDDDFKFLANPRRAISDMSGWDMNWDTQIDYDVAVSGSVNDNSNTDQGYTVEMVIPWQDWGILQPGFGSSWGMNIALNDKPDAATYPTQVPWSDPDPDNVNIPDYWNDALFTVRTDTSGDGCVDPAELNAFINLWYLDSTEYQIGELMEAVGLWKAGTGCPSS